MTQQEPPEQPYVTAEAAQRYLRHHGQELGGVLAILQRLIVLLEQRQALLGKLVDDHAWAHGDREPLRRLLHENRRELAAVLHELERLLPPDTEGTV